MQDKEGVEETEEVQALKAEPEARKDSDAKDNNKFAFRKMKTSKKEKADKNRAVKYEGEGVTFKAKLIGVETVPDPKGDKMCQDAMQRLKLNVKNIGPHKRKINICVSLQGVKIKDEKCTSVIFHHPVPTISFIAQDITDARAFGYIFGCAGEPLQLIAIKTEKPAFHVVIALRELFQTFLTNKQQEIEQAKQQVSSGAPAKTLVPETQVSKEVLPPKSVALVPSISELNALLQSTSVSSSKEEPPKPPEPETENPKVMDENIYFEVLLTEPLEMKEDQLVDTKVPEKTVDQLLGLQDQVNRLQEGILQMDNSIAAGQAFTSGMPEDPFDTSFVLGAKRPSIPVPMPTPVPAMALAASRENLDFDGLSSGDKYAAFAGVGGGPSLFEDNNNNNAEELRELEEEIARKTTAAPPPKPPRGSKSPDLSLFADLDPLGKDRPYMDKAEFFRDVKNPPKKVLNDLVDPNREPVPNHALSSSVPFPVDFDSSFPKKNAPNPFDTPDGGAPYLGKSPPGALTSQLAVNCNLNEAHNHALSLSMSSSPIPIPPRHPGLAAKDRSLSNGSIGSPYSKSPQTYSSDSPDQSSNGYFIQNYSSNYSDSDSPTAPKNGLSSSPTGCAADRFNGNSQNGGVSRPRPRPSMTLNKGPQQRIFSSSHSLSSDSSSDYDTISRENMQSITNMLVTNGHRLRAKSLCIDTNNEFKLPSDNKNIFNKKQDPFADEFFVPKKLASRHLAAREIPDYV